MTDKTEKSTVLEEQAGEDLKPCYVKITVEQQKQINYVINKFLPTTK